jgi:hypothetical protein
MCVFMPQMVPSSFSLRLAFGWFLFVLSFVLVPAWAQQTIHVPTDKPTIQAGIDAANNGDTVLVSPGTYLENIDFRGKAITVTSGVQNSTDAASTIIQGARNGSVVTFQTAESDSSILNGFTIQGAFGTLQSTSNGVYVAGASPQIQNNLIQKNVGCGVVVTGQSSPVFRGNRITLNRGPIAGEPESPYCSSGDAGTAIDIFDSVHPQLIGNLIENNTCHDGQNTPLNLSTCGLVITGGQEILIQSNIIRNNGVAFGSGAANRDYLTATIEFIQNLIYNDSPDVQDPGLVGSYDQNATSADAPTLIAVNNTFYNVNFAVGNFFAPSQADNNVFVQTSFGPTANVINPYTLFVCGGNGMNNTHYMTTLNNDLYAEGYPQTNNPCPLTANNIASDPQFIADVLTNPGQGNLRVQHGSPVVYAGTLSAPMIPATDLDGKNRTVCGMIDMGAYQTHPIPPITLTSAPNPSVGGTTVNFGLSVRGNCNTPTGVVTLFDGQTTLGTAMLDASGNAAFSTAALTVGTHAISATYPGDFNFDPSSSNTVNQVVTGPPTQATLQIVPNPAQAFQSITFSSTVASNFGTPTGDVTFYSNGQELTSATLSSGGTAVTSINTLGAGTYTITAAYGASTAFGGSTSQPVTLIVNGVSTSTTLSSSPNPSTFGQTVSFTAAASTSPASGVASGSVTFMEGSATLGTDVLSPAGIAVFNTSALAVGSHAIRAIYGGASNYNASTSAAVVQVVNPAPSSISLTGTPNPAALGALVTLSANVTGNGSPLASGSVNFSDQFGTIGTAGVSAGQATLATSGLAAGTHNIVATYNGGSSFAGASSTVFVEVIQSFDFSIALSPQSLSLASGSSESVAVRIQGVGNLPGNVDLAVSKIPQYGSGTFAATPVSFVAGGTGSSTLTVNTVQIQPHAAFSNGRYSKEGFSQVMLAGLLSLPLLLLRKRSRENGRRIALLLIVLAALVPVSLTGCTNIYYPLNRVAPGTYSLPITGVDRNSGISHTTILTLTVTP